jgi:hypothetical protein
MVDAIWQMLQSIDATGSEGERNDEALVETLTKLKQGGFRAAFYKAHRHKRYKLESQTNFVLAFAGLGFR